jgi:hypothetical protein
MSIAVNNFSLKNQLTPTPSTSLTLYRTHKSTITTTLDTKPFRTKLTSFQSAASELRTSISSKDFINLGSTHGLSVIHLWNYADEEEATNATTATEGETGKIWVG